MEPEFTVDDIIELFKSMMPRELTLELAQFYFEARYPRQFLLMEYKKGFGGFGEFDTCTEKMIGLYQKFNNCLFDYLRVYFTANCFMDKLHDYDSKTDTW